jgi:hypothetical protein
MLWAGVDYISLVDFYLAHILTCRIKLPYPRSTNLFCFFLRVGSPKTVLKGGYLGWLCKLFDKALVVALACAALAMCLQMRGLYFPFFVLFSNTFKLSK